MIRNIMSVLVLSLVVTTVAADVYILDDPKPVQKGKRGNGWQLGTGVIPVPEEANRPVLAQTTRLPSDGNQPTGIEEIAAQTGGNPDDYFVVEEELAGSQVDVPRENISTVIDANGLPVPTTDLSKAQKRERKIATRARRDILNLDLKDDSKPKNTIDATKGNKNCTEFQYFEGLLKNNLERMLANCGYSIGQWEFGDAEYDYDFPVKKNYVLGSKNLVQFLDQVKQTYLIDYHVHELDRTVDFSPSRGDRLKDLELRYR